MIVRFPLKKLLKRFTMDDFPDTPDDFTKPEEAAWAYGKEVREGLEVTGLIEWFGVVVKSVRRMRNTWDVWLESWEGITGALDIGNEKLKNSWLHRRSRSEED
jgi:hypothetical protein